MRVLYFGTYERTHPRNAQVISCLRQAGVEVLEHHEPVWDGYEHKWNAGLGALARLTVAEARLLFRTAPQADLLLVGYPGHVDLPAARRVARGRPVVLNPLVSLDDTFVADRLRFRPGSSAARLLRRLDGLAFRSADLVVADTQAHAQLFQRLGARRVETVLVGAEERVFAPGWTPPETPLALFVGKLIPLQGVDVVLAAARSLPEVRFRIVGSGQLNEALRDVPPNVDRVPWLPYEALADEYRRATVALGIFGTTAKASRVIPNKVFQALACGAPVVTADTPAARELLVNDESALLVPGGDSRALAAAVSKLVADQGLARRLAGAGFAVYRTRASEEVLGRRWRSVLEQLR